MYGVTPTAIKDSCLSTSRTSDRGSSADQGHASETYNQDLATMGPDGRRGDRREKEGKLKKLKRKLWARLVSPEPL